MYYSIFGSEWMDADTFKAYLILTDHALMTIAVDVIEEGCIATTGRFSTNWEILGDIPKVKQLPTDPHYTAVEINELLESLDMESIGRKPLRMLFRSYNKL